MVKYKNIAVALAVYALHLMAFELGAGPITRTLDRQKFDLSPALFFIGAARRFNLNALHLSVPVGNEIIPGVIDRKADLETVFHQPCRNLLNPDCSDP